MTLFYMISIVNTATNTVVVLEPFTQTYFSVFCTLSMSQYVMTLNRI